MNTLIAVYLFLVLVCVVMGYEINPKRTIGAQLGIWFGALLWPVFITAAVLNQIAKEH